MKGFESSPPFNPADNPEQLIDPEVERNAGTAVPFLGTLEMKFKKYVGRLNQKHFDRLLDLDFQEQLQNNPPIDGIFSPEKELEKIKKLPKEQKKRPSQPLRKI